MSRLVCQFSCGAASAVATKITLAEHANVLIVNAFLAEEHPDNRRFAADCERWFGHDITVLRDAKYNASTHEVWRRKRFIKGLRGAPCSATLKRDLLSVISHPGDINVIGFTAEEVDRADRLQDSFPDVKYQFPLVERGLTKSDCLAVIDRAGLVLPEMYRLGYANANCIGCPKGGQSYWQAIRRDFPEQFHQIRVIQEDIGPASSFLRFRSGPRKGERMGLAELPEGNGDMSTELHFSCSFACDIAEQDFSN